MNIKDIFSRYSDETPELVFGAISSVVAAFNEKKAVTQAACDAYFADLKEKQDRLNARIADIEKQIAEVEGKIESTTSALVEATEEGDAKRYEGIRAMLHNLEAEKSSLLFQMDTLENAVPHKSKDLHDAVESASNDLGESGTDFEAEMEAIKRFIKMRLEAWKELDENAHFPLVVKHGHLVEDTAFIEDVDKVEMDYNGWD